MDRPMEFTKIDLTPRRHHGYAVLLFIFGTLFPPLAVAARFGIGNDFWLNLLLTICGYIPGHGHNFYIQNIRNNKTHRRTPKWAIRYGLVDTTEIRRKEKKSQWAHRYGDRLPHSVLEGQEYEEGQNPSASAPNLGGAEADEIRRRREAGGDLWTADDEHYYGQRRASGGSTANAEAASVDSGATGGGRWRYPANFEDSEPPLTPVGGGKGSKLSLKKNKKGKKDRFALAEDARRGIVEDNGNSKKKKKKSSSSKKSTLDGDNGYLPPRSDSRSDIGEEPEDAVGGLYGDRNAAPVEAPLSSEDRDKQLFEHQF